MKYVIGFGVLAIFIWICVLYLGALFSPPKPRGSRYGGEGYPWKDTYEEPDDFWE